MLNKIKKIIAFSALAILLTGCTSQVQELKQSIEKQIVKQDIETEEKDPSEMSLEEVEEELESMKDIEVEEDLNDLDEEL